MIPRYEDKVIKWIWSNENKLKLWQAVELAVIQARETLGIFSNGTYEKIKSILENIPIDIEWWKAKDKEIGHDLNAFIDERLRHLPSELHQFFHKGMTSYDTEEAPLSLMLLASIEHVKERAYEVKTLLKNLMQKYRYTPMLGRTHGQEAKVQSFGKRCLTWHEGLRVALSHLMQAEQSVQYSKLSGAIGNYQGLTPLEEEQALKLLDLVPFKGATQIMPRQIYLPVAFALVEVVGALTQIAEDIRLGARSGLPILQEPFGKKQKGSSAMPHKKNTITCEQQIGMFTMAKGFAGMNTDRLVTWEERAIEQSCVERVAWPDLFHVAMRSFDNMIKVLSGLQVFPDNMLLEIINSRGCYASEDAKDWLKEKFAEYGLSHEDAYRLVQLAAFLVHKPSHAREQLRANPPESYDDAEGWLIMISADLRKTSQVRSLKDVIQSGELMTMEELDIMPAEIQKWQEVLQEIFSKPENVADWEKIFTISYQLRNEHFLFEE